MATCCRLLPAAPLFLPESQLPIQTSANIVFLTLKCFAATGGIEQFNRSFAKALCDNAKQYQWQVCILSMYDHHSDERYVPASHFRGFRASKWRAAWHMIRYMRKADVVVVGHINLSVLVLLARWMGCRAPVLMVAHGREVWALKSHWQQRALQAATSICCVSRFTEKLLLQNVPAAANKTIIFPNTLDPFFQASQEAGLQALPQQILPPGNPRLLTLARISAADQAKGYEMVLELLPRLIPAYPSLQYIIAGSWEPDEYHRLQKRMAALQLEQHVAFTGFVPPNDLPALFEQATVFVMPSRKEGFGIVFLEAAWMGMRIIGGNADGSPEALLNGQLGVLIDPADEEALYEALVAQLEAPPLTAAQKENRRAMVAEAFGFEKFRQRQAALLLDKLSSRP